MKILLVRLSSMGDLIHTLPAISDLMQHCPDIELHWLCENGFADIARLHPFVKKVLPMHWRKWRKNLFQAAVRSQMADLRTQLLSERYDWVLDSQGLIKSAVFAKLTHAPITGLDKNSAREPWASWFYARQFAVEKGRDAVWRNRRLFAQAFDYQENHIVNFGIQVPTDIWQTLSGSLNLSTQYHVALHATSRDSKLWAQENWLQLFQLLHETDGLPIYLPWGNAAEKMRAENMAAALPFLRVLPALNLLQAATLLQHAKAVIGVDTGLLHLANAADVPLVGIYTDSDPIKTGVQTSPYAVNLGGVGQMPDVQTVFTATQNVLTAKK
ncbi:MAG: lipopolysaccharide heptosyltransferase I [Alysiella sp.]|uniref:lipopolysaccharide heptosyltransferase I n=1 Tax=Alysiella sp. TaxID=1872483 RepID=UPI0026DB7966|nr:lipopolysaccharide heptosyltransferase I [Alysiella sp.]MDO4433659.1 lipopolysaccharide heptosyltransferase I [Alysiella sp.]